ncbi:hypothetical protein H5410_035954 [Solanum commersonii]|uniref:G-patch domain-containing protein n=1 Tax=Solanum commersonii TaxID=4109 RepID=A0A9J5Y417_SOLCO|nr:hypothetical protein H5410_035954 [Solanum commersonii]
MTTLITRKPKYDTKALDGATFHTLEIMQAIRVGEEAEAWYYTKLSSATKMVASEMLKYGYQPNNGLGPKGTNGLGYEPSLGRDRRGSSDTIFVLEQALIPDQAGIYDIIDGIGDLFVAMVGEEEEININKLTIRNFKPQEIL